MHSISVTEIRWKCIFRVNSCPSPLGFDVDALIPQGLAGSLNFFGFLNNLVTLINCQSLKEIGEMACVTPARSSRGHTLNQSCSFTYPSKESQIVHYCIAVGLLLVLPLSICIFSHYKIFLKTKEHQYDVF